VRAHERGTGGVVSDDDPTRVEPRSRAPLYAVLVLAAIALVIIVVTVVSRAGNDDAATAPGADRSTTTERRRTTTTEPQQTAIEEAVEIVDPAVAAYFSVQDDGHTLVVDGAGEFGIGADIPNMAAVLVELGVPGSLTAQMDRTRALDGVQEETWQSAAGSFSVSWTYHPDNGLDLIVVEAP
jgi:hypothetical protein